MGIGKMEYAFSSSLFRLEKVQNYINQRAFQFFLISTDNGYSVDKLLLDFQFFLISTGGVWGGGDEVVLSVLPYFDKISRGKH